MAGGAAVDDLYPALDQLLDPALTTASARLRADPRLGADERRAVLAGLRSGLRAATQRLVTRVLLVELNAARVTGRLRAPDPPARWREFLATAGRPGFWTGLATHYPTLLPRVDQVVGHRCAAAVEAAHRFAADRTELAALLGGPVGDLVGLSPGAGDSHDSGRTVCRVDGAGGRLVYKPRPLDVDDALATLLTWLRARVPDLDAGVPPVLCRPGYGWAQWVEHRYCGSDGELSRFYRGIGQLLALMQLLGGSDLHAENLIACGPVPMVVDCETLFTPHPPTPPSGLGAAVDRAAALIDGSVLRVGLLPSRGSGLGWRGIDASAVGSLPGQQPSMAVPTMVGAGTDTARLGYEKVLLPPAQNHPTPAPALRRFWPDILAGFRDLGATLRALDAGGELAGALRPFGDCRIRVVLRDTESYAELMRMLWHPVSLHDEPAAVRRATELLTGQAENRPGAPGAPEVVAAEVAELLPADVPIFVTTPRSGRLTGPGGTTPGGAGDLLTAALDRWRAADAGQDEAVIRASLVSAYLNESWEPDDRMSVAVPRTAGLDRRRRHWAATVVRRIRDAAIRGPDGTAAWAAPVLSPVGWQVQPSGPDLYGGAAGIAVLLAGYRHETGHGRAEPVDGIAELHEATLRTVRSWEDRAAADRTRGAVGRPPPPGGYLGLGSQVWSWLVQAGVAGVPDAVDRAVAAARLVPATAAATEESDLLVGTAGAVVPLLHLAAATADPTWRAAAADLGRAVVAAGTPGPTAGTLCWPAPRSPQGLGGFAHGATGIGWALARLAAVTGDPEFARAAAAAFRYEDGTWDEAAAGWRDLRESPPGEPAAAWCHGAGGIGLAAADLLARTGQQRHRDTLRRAAATCWTRGLGWSHTLCHGDLGAWELLTAAARSGVGPDGLAEDGLAARVLTGLDEHGPVIGLARDAFSPGLFTGLAGIAYQLLRLHPDSELPSVLLLDLPAAGR